MFPRSHGADPGHVQLPVTMVGMSGDAGGLRPPLPLPVAELTPDNLRALIEDMGNGPGWYASGALYAWYAGMCAEDNLIPVSPKKFGMTLKALGYRQMTQRVDGKHSRGWFIARRALRADPPREAASQ